MLQLGDIVVAASSGSRAIVGKAAQLHFDWQGAFGAFCFGLRPEQLIEPRFVGWFLHTQEYRSRISNASAGVNINNLRAEHIEETPVLFPPLAEQVRIADALDELLSDLDAGVTALERVRDKLKLYRAAVLKAAVEGALTAQWRKDHPQAEPASQLLKRILAERRHRWEEEQLRKFKDKGREPPKNWKSKYKAPVAPDTTGLPPLPERWCWASVGQLGEVGTGATPNKGQKSRYYTGGTLPWVTSSCVNARWVRAATEFVTPAALEECNLTLYPAGTLLLAMYGEGKTRGKCSELLIEATTNQALAAIQIAQDLRGYLKVFLAKNYDQTRRGASGGVQPNLNLGIVREIALPLPPQAEQELVVEAVESQLSVIDQLEAELAAKFKSIQALRQSILRQAFVGKLVPQNPNDEPASELLKRIAAERELHTHEAVAVKRWNSRKPLAAAKKRSNATCGKTISKEFQNGRIADR